MNHATLSESLIYQRTLKGYSQEELAHLSSVGIRTIQRIEKGEVNPHLQTLKLLAEALAIDISELVVLQNPNEEIIQRKWMLLIHGTPFLGFIIPFANVLIPLFIWIAKAEDNAIYDAHGRAVVNFHGTINLVLILSLGMFFILPGFNFIFTAAVVLFGLITTLVNISMALNKQKCTYPLSIPFLKPRQ